MPQRFFSFLLIAVLFGACSPNNVTVDNSIGKYFDSAGVKGSFGLYDNGQGHFTIYNLSRFRDSAYAAGATFDILTGLIALQTGIATNDTSAVLRYQMVADSVNPGEVLRVTTSDPGKQGEPISLKAIFQNGSAYNGSWLLARRIGKDSLKKWVDTLGYGNKDLSCLADTTGREIGLKIPADQQMGLIKKLYFEQLPFFARTQQLVKKMFLKEQNSNYQIVYKTGKTVGADGKVNAWVLGWVEENKHPYFFVLNMESADVHLDAANVGIQLVKNILSPMGFFAGKK